MQGAASIACVQWGEYLAAKQNQGIWAGHVHHTLNLLAELRPNLPNDQTILLVPVRCTSDGSQKLQACQGKNCSELDGNQHVVQPISEATSRRAPSAPGQQR